MRGGYRLGEGQRMEDVIANWAEVLAGEGIDIWDTLPQPASNRD